MEFSELGNGFQFDKDQPFYDQVDSLARESTIACI